MLHAPHHGGSENVRPTTSHNIVDTKAHAQNKPAEPAQIIVQHSTKDAYGNPIVKKFLRGPLLGKGGFAKCYQFTDMASGAIWAGKVVAKASLTKQRHKAKLQTEIKIHKALNHQYVVKIEEVFEDHENVYLMMELCESQTLLELVKRKRRLSESEARHFMNQLISACKYLHGVRVIHRDLKLGNLFLANRTMMKIGDFGLATKLAYDGERKRTLCGTPNYIAPEVLEQGGHSYEVDVWSIGVILYTMVVGKPPFETADVKSTYKRIKANAYSFPADKPHSTPISAACKDLIRRSLNSDPARRPTMDEMLQSEFMRGTESVDRPISLGDNARVPLRALANVESAKAESKSSKPDYGYTASGATAYSSSRPTSSATVSSAAAPEEIYKEKYGLKPYSSSTQSRDVLGRDYLSSRPSTATTARATTSSTTSSRPRTAAIAESSTKNQNNNAEGRGYELRSASTKTTTASEDKGAANDNGMRPTTSERPSTGKTDFASGAKAAGDNGGKDDMPLVAAGPEDEDRGTLHHMHLNLQKSFADVPTVTATAGPPATGDALPLPAVWVSKWVDYSKKYGLGYKLSDGTAGVFFNDATKMLLEPEARLLEYIERVTLSVGVKQDIRKTHVYASHPSELKKKVTLLQHFKSYLEENQKEGVDVPAPANDGKQVVDASGESVYVRKWMRTRHSIIFRMSNNNFQVNFFDGTEVFLWSESRWVTYLNKQKERKTYELSAVLAYPELAKRIKYVKDILSHLIGRS